MPDHLESKAKLLDLQLEQALDKKDPKLTAAEIKERLEIARETHRHPSVVEGFDNMVHGERGTGRIMAGVGKDLEMEPHGYNYKRGLDKGALIYKEITIFGVQEDGTKVNAALGGPALTQFSAMLTTREAGELQASRGIDEAIEAASEKALKHGKNFHVPEGLIRDIKRNIDLTTDMIAPMIERGEAKEVENKEKAAPQPGPQLAPPQPKQAPKPIAPPDDSKLPPIIFTHHVPEGVPSAEMQAALELFEPASATTPDALSAPSQPRLAKAASR